MPLFNHAITELLNCFFPLLFTYTFVISGHFVCNILIKSNKRIKSPSSPSPSPSSTAAAAASPAETAVSHRIYLHMLYCIQFVIDFTKVSYVDCLWRWTAFTWSRAEHCACLASICFIIRSQTWLFMSLASAYLKMQTILNLAFFPAPREMRGNLLTMSRQLIVLLVSPLPCGCVTHIWAHGTNCIDVS